ncbi:MAG: hypothetical protein LIO74_00935 [Ruminococcus sp.]|nr:hypothetical protein [Ruminococcus sp.]
MKFREIEKIKVTDFSNAVFSTAYGKKRKKQREQSRKKYEITDTFHFPQCVENFVENLFRDVKIKNYAIKCWLFGESVRIFMASPKDQLT